MKTTVSGTDDPGQRRVSQTATSSEAKLDVCPVTTPKRHITYTTAQLHEKHNIAFYVIVDQRFVRICHHGWVLALFIINLFYWANTIFNLFGNFRTLSNIFQNICNAPVSDLSRKNKKCRSEE